MEITGLSAFALTPCREDSIDFEALSALIARLTAAGSDSVAVLGSTGCGMLVDRAERRAVVETAVAAAGSTPVIAGVSALRTRDARSSLLDAEAAGASAALLSPVGYHRLTPHEVTGLFAEVCRGSDLPVIVYDNPTTTGFAFTPEHYAQIAEIDTVVAVKIPGVPADPADARSHVGRIRELLPDRVRIGVSQDRAAARGLAAGCDAWFSVLGGVLPEPALALTRAALGGDSGALADAEAAPEPLLGIVDACAGSVRVMAAVAAAQGWADVECLPAPLRALDPETRGRVAEAVAGLR